MKKGGD